MAKAIREVTTSTAGCGQQGCGRDQPAPGRTKGGGCSRGQGSRRRAQVRPGHHPQRHERDQQVEPERDRQGEQDRRGEVAFGALDLFPGGGDHVEAAEGEEGEQGRAENAAEPHREKGREAGSLDMRKARQREPGQADDGRQHHGGLRGGRKPDADQVHGGAGGDQRKSASHGRESGQDLQVAAEPEGDVPADEDVGAPESPAHDEAPLRPENRPGEGIAAAGLGKAAGKLGVGDRDEHGRQEGQHKRQEGAGASHPARGAHQHEDPPADGAAHAEAHRLPQREHPPEAAVLLPRNRASPILIPIHVHVWPAR